jgi:hypothetical protein
MDSELEFILVLPALFSPAFIVDPRHPAVMLSGIFCPPTFTVFNEDGIGRLDGLKKWFKSLLTYIYIFLHYLVHSLNACLGTVGTCLIVFLL